MFCTFITPSRGRCPLETPIRGLRPLNPCNFSLRSKLLWAGIIHMGWGGSVSKSTISCEKKPFYIRCVVHSMKFYYHFVKKFYQASLKHSLRSCFKLKPGKIFSLHGNRISSRIYTAHIENSYIRHSNELPSYFYFTASENVKYWPRITSKNGLLWPPLNHSLRSWFKGGHSRPFLEVILGQYNTFSTAVK